MNVTSFNRNCVPELIFVCAISECLKRSTENFKYFLNLFLSLLTMVNIDA